MTTRSTGALFLAALASACCGCGDDDASSSTGGQGGSTTGTGGSGANGGSAQGGSAQGGSATGGSGGTAQTTFVPYFADDFESYTDGDSLSGGNPFDTAGRTTASAQEAYRGAQSARMEILQGDNGGFGKWGAAVGINPIIVEGGEIWLRLQVNWPASFQFTATPWMKFLRLHNRQGNGDNAGYNDLYVHNADSTTSVLRTIKEIHDIWDVYDGPSLPRDTWESYEMYLFVEDHSVDGGGQGRVRIWRDDELIFDRTDVPTITAADGSIDLVYLFTYWNNENPPDNHCFIDDVVIATDAGPPTNVDAAGNKFIGPYVW